MFWEKSKKYLIAYDKKCDGTQDLINLDTKNIKE